MAVIFEVEVFWIVTPTFPEIRAASTSRAKWPVWGKIA
jgi:hypothetical protein